MKKFNPLGIELRRAAAFIRGEKFYAAADGSILEPEGGEMKPGVKLNVKLPDGTLQPAPAGDIVLEDGSTVVVSADGMIVEIKPKEEAAPADPAQDMNKQAPKSVEQTTSTITLFSQDAKNELRALFSEVVNEAIEKRLSKSVTNETFSQHETEVEKFKKSVDEKLSAIATMVEKIGSEPSSQSFSEKRKPLGEEVSRTKSKALEIAEQKLKQN